MLTRRTPLLALGLAVALGACQAQTPPASPAQIAARAAAMTPPGARLADLYAHACKACHAVPGSGAPLAGDRAAWAPRARKGMAALTQSIVAGRNGMPAGGQCFSCSLDDYRALARFMADQPIS
jgi:cytochrome c5